MKRLVATLRYLCRIKPQVAMPESSSRYGFVAFAEAWNGRLAILGQLGLG